MSHHLEQATICIIGLDYVGLPLAEAFSKSLRVIGFDTNAQKVNQLNELNKQTALTDQTALTSSTKLLTLDAGLSTTNLINSHILYSLGQPHYSK